MTTSGNSDWNPQAVYIITRSYRQCGVIAENETPTAGMLSDALITLNAMVKEWQASGIHVWTEEEAIVFLQEGQIRYLLGGSSLDNSSAADDWVQSELFVNAIAGAVSVTIDPPVVLNGQHIGIVLDAGPTWWTTVTSSVAGVVGIADALPSAASAQNTVVAYNTRIIRPLKVPTCRRLQYASPGTTQGNNETPMTVLSRQEYEDLPNKHSPGIPTQFFYSPKLVQGEFYVWPAPANSQSAARVTWYRPIQNFDTLNDTSDMPQEWLNALTWNLSQEMGPEFDIPPPRWQIIQSQAAQKLDMVQSWDRESEPIEFGIDWQHR